MSESVTIYKCADGTDFPVTWDNEDNSESTWFLDDIHYTTPLKPLDIAAWKLSLPARERVYSEAGFPLERLRKVLAPHGFVYFTRPTIPAHFIDDFAERCGGITQIWEERCLPLTREGCAKLQTAADDTPILELIDTCFYAFTQTSVAGAVTNAVVGRLSQFLGESFGSEAKGLTSELTQGYANATVGLNQALWEIAQIARRYLRLRDLMLNANAPITPDTLAQVEGGNAFLAAFHDFMRRFCWLSDGWEAGLPTWGEQSARPLEIIRRMINEEAPSPERALQGVARQRQERADEVTSRLREDPAKLSRFRNLLQQASSHVSIRESRAVWQLIVFGSFRAALLRCGEKMMREGRIGHADDILYLLPDEIERQDEVSPSTFHSTIAERRAQRERWLNMKPPREIGAVSRGILMAAGGDAGSSEARNIRGIAASRGVVTGPAKIIREVGHGDKLMPGDILVCKTSSPSWSVLFGRAAAVVTETGGALGHAAITAREYGIPCVVGARGATELIHNRMRITVDGSRGVVQFEA